MTDNDFLTFQKFTNKSEATELTELLTTNNIKFLIEDTSASFDPSFANNEINKEFRVKLKKEDFDKVDKLMLNISASQLNEIDENYYLFEFTDVELLEVLTKSDEWSKFDYLLAQKILKDRGQEVNEKILENLRRKRIEELPKPEESQKSWVITGYIFALMGGFFGLFIGWHLLAHKKTLPNGDRVYGYSIEDRIHGNRILILGIVFLIIWTIIKIVTND
jgi:translation elongation factor EF-G